MNDHYNNDLNQRWLIIENEIVSKGIQDQNDQSRCLDVYYSSTDNGATVSVYSRHGGQNQMWELTCIENCDVKQPNCTSSRPCGLDEGHCESNEQCTDDLVCGIDNCKPELGYSNETNCCYNINDYCSQFLSGENGTWTIKTPINNSNVYVSEVTCQWYIDVVTNTHYGGSRSATCGAAVSDWTCCTSNHPCMFPDGDCDYDSDCRGGLYCGTDNCGPAFPSGFDCCELPDFVTASDIVNNLNLQTYEVSFPPYEYLLCFI